MIPGASDGHREGGEEELKILFLNCIWFLGMEN